MKGGWWLRAPCEAWSAKPRVPSIGWGTAALCRQPPSRIAAMSPSAVWNLSSPPGPRRAGEFRQKLDLQCFSCKIRAGFGIFQ